MDYPTARNQINTGDVLAIHGRTVLARLTHLAQSIAGLKDRASVSHMGVAWWVEGRLYSVEMDGRHNVLRPLSQHIADGCAVDVYPCPVPGAMAAQFDRATASPIKYSIPDLVRIGARLVFGGGSQPAQADSETEMVCSTFVARWLQWAGWVPPPGLPNMPSPGEVCLALGKPAFSIDGARP